MQSIIQIDAFADRPFSGNPAAVCVMREAADESWMQNVAAEMNLSETAFLFPERDGYNLRWFTPVAEVKLCGHATLASAHALYDGNYVAEDKTIEFYTKSGTLTARSNSGLIVLDFPATTLTNVALLEELPGALGVTPIAVFGAGEDILVELGAAEEVRRARPDFRALRELAGRGVIITAASDVPEFDFISRFFAPAFGVDEDPVTGSAHCALAPFWGEKLKSKTLRAYQASERGGKLTLTLEGNRVLIAGSAVTVLRGNLL